MKKAKKWAAMLLCLLLAGTCAGCSLLPSEDFDDYDVSSYIQALLDSSYHDSHTAFVAITQATEDSAKANNTTTVENAAINFCNAYDLSPNDQQLDRLEEIIRQILLSAKYTVKDEEKIETGYNIEVDVSPITSFVGIEAEINQLRTQAQEEANKANATPTPEPTPEGEAGWDEGVEYGWDEWGNWMPLATPTPEPTPSPTPAPQVDYQKLFVDKVLDRCQEKAANPEFQGQDVAIVLDIRLTSEGELQLDLNQLDDIDRTVLLFQKQ